jgi:hypothetical protein
MFRLNKKMEDAGLILHGDEPGQLRFVTGKKV